MPSIPICVASCVAKAAKAAMPTPSILMNCKKGCM